MCDAPERGGGAAVPDTATLLRACRALGLMLQEEYGATPLAELADLHGRWNLAGARLTDEDVAAVAAAEALVTLDEREPDDECEGAP